MIKKLVKVGNSQALILDKTLLDLLGVEPGAEVQVTARDRSITIAPTDHGVPNDQFEAAKKRIFDKHGEALKRLA